MHLAVELSERVTTSNVVWDIMMMQRDCRFAPRLAHLDSCLLQVDTHAEMQMCSARKHCCDIHSAHCIHKNCRCRKRSSNICTCKICIEEPVTSSCCCMAACHPLKGCNLFSCPHQVVPCAPTIASRILPLYERLQVHHVCAVSQNKERCPSDMTCSPGGACRGDQ